VLVHLAVCLKQVASRDWPVRLDPSGRHVDQSQATFELNEPDSYALEAALRLRDEHGGEVVAVSAGPARVVQVLREALARGADRALHVAGDHLPAADGFTTAAALAHALGSEPADLVLTGLQSDDQGFGQVGGMLAELLGRPHASIVMAVEREGDGVRVKRELEGGWSQWVRLPMPAVLTIQSGINQLRYATLKGIMAAKKKACATVEAPPPALPRQRVVRVFIAERTSKARLFGGTASEAAAALVGALRDDRVI
jgi:electron transfer flavoprotein beta subunit